MTIGDEDIDSRLSELGRATEALKPRADFNARVMRSLEPERGAGFAAWILKPARRILPVAVLAATIAVGWAVQSEGAVDEALAVSYDATMELEW